MSTCSRSYGIVLNEMYSVYKFDKRDLSRDAVTDNIVAQEQLTWLIRRGDLLLSDANKVTEKQFMYHFQEGDVRDFKLPVYEYPDDDDDEPDRFETAGNGM